jgi:hypothetical protein
MPPRMIWAVYVLPFALLGLLAWQIPENTLRGASPTHLAVLMGPVVLLALLGPIILSSSGGRVFFGYVVLLWIVGVVVPNWRFFSPSFFAHSPGEASANFLAGFLSYGLPIWGAALFIWKTRKQHASVLLQSVGALAVGVVLLQFYKIVLLFLLLFLIEVVLGIH